MKSIRKKKMLQLKRKKSLKKKIGKKNTKKLNKKRNKIVKKTNKRNVKKLECSANESSNSFSCYTNKQLFKLQKYWNLRYPSQQIKDTIPYDIWQKLQYYMQNICNTDDCWLRQKFVTLMNDTELSFDEIYAPKAPEKWKKNKNTWLSSLDILRVMKQYEKKNKHFDFIGPSPIDFDKRLSDGNCVWNEICNFELKKSLLKGRTDIGFIFNTDEHDEPGSHWVALHLHINKKNKDGYLFYLDSVGDEIPDEIEKLRLRIQKQAQQVGYTLKLMDTNGLKHQYKTTECGVYCIYFIVSLMKQIHTPEYWQTHRIPDHVIEEYRSKFWNMI